MARNTLAAAVPLTAFGIVNAQCRKDEQDAKEIIKDDQQATENCKAQNWSHGTYSGAKKEIAVVADVRSMATAASGNALAAIAIEEPFGLSSLAFFHLSTATNTSSAPSPNMTKVPMKLRKGKRHKSVEKESQGERKDNLKKTNER
jgi:hypothetical protein